MGESAFLGCWKTLLELETLGMQLVQMGSERIFEKVSLSRLVFGSIYLCLAFRQRLSLKLIWKYW